MLHQTVYFTLGKVLEKMTHLQEAPPPVLRFVELAKVLAHEEADHQRYERLIHRIAESGVWLHPPIVAPLPDSDGRYVILDGANRCHSLTALQFPHIIVQIANYESDQVQLETWSHVVSGFPVQDFIHDVRAIEGVTVREVDLLTAQAELAQRDIAAYILDLHANHVYALEMATHTLAQRNKILRALVATYKHHGKLDRISQPDANLVRQLYPQADALVVFPHYEPAEIMVAARDNEPLPAGISRHIIQGRAMRLNYPLDILRDAATTLDAKNAALEAWVLERFGARAVRFYAESTYMFDE